MMVLLTPTSTIAQSRPPTVAGPATSATATELRLAVVCDGGVSLAIYEHGVTKELQHAVRASRAFDTVASGVATQEQARASLSGTECEYFDALVSRDSKITVVIDVISGTSAGGINGVCLAKAIARNVSQDPLTEMWMQRADLKILAKRKFSAGLRSALVETALALPGHIFDRGWAPLHGELMSRWLVEAMQDMDGTRVDGAPASLMPADHDLDLFITSTNLRGYIRIIPSLDGGAGEYGRNHRKVFHYNSYSSPDAFGTTDNPGLAFAARCTSSFPGAFEPSNLADFAAIVSGETVAEFDETAFVAQHLAEYDLSGDSSRTTYFADGGLLDNTPFDHVVTAISAKPAQSQVQRCVVHIDPDPDALPTAGPAGAPAEPTPRYVNGLRAALKVRSSQSSVSDLEDIQTMNGVITRIGRITERLEGKVSEFLQSLAKDRTRPPTWEETRQWADAIHGQVPSVAGAWNIPTYEGLKVALIGEMFAGDLATAFEYPPEVQQSTFIAEVFAEWANAKTGMDDAQRPDLAQFLDDADMPYRERRLRFAISCINGLYGGADEPTTESLNLLKAGSWAVLNELLTFRAATADDLVKSGTAEFLSPAQLGATGDLVDPATFATTNAGAIDALVTDYATRLATYDKDSAQRLWEGFTTTVAGWTGPAQAGADRLLYRYLGFPIWDALTFPVIALSRLPQLTPIQLQRFSPQDARLLVAPKRNDGTASKLRGTAVDNFGGFLDQSWRENDYLWGRLDACELIMSMVGRRGWNEITAAAFTAILREEGPKLSNVQDLIANLEAQITAAVPS